MQVKYITYGQLLALCQNHKYLLLRRASGRASVLNCGLAKVAQRKLNREANEETGFVSFRAIGLNEYISLKAPFV